MDPAVAVVGDVHGDSESLAAVTDWLLTSWGGDVVFVGDYVNRGPDAKGVLEGLVRLRRTLGSRLTLLLGNHDAVLLEFLVSGDRERFLAHGGLQTMRSYLDTAVEADPFGQFRRTFPAPHLELLQSLDTSYETEDLLITHAGFDPSRPASRAPEDVVFGRFPELFEGGLETPRPIVVCGHYLQRDRKPYCSDNFVCLDSGCGSVPGGPLSVMVLPTREFRAFGGDV